ncbi:MAG TPA: hypothetical protein VGE01_09880 [Fimbriimonas sp.]
MKIRTILSAAVLTLGALGTANAQGFTEQRAAEILAKRFSLSPSQILRDARAERVNVYNLPPAYAILGATRGADLDDVLRLRRSGASWRVTGDRLGMTDSQLRDFDRRGLFDARRFWNSYSDRDRGGRITFVDWWHDQFNGPYNDRYNDRYDDRYDDRWGRTRDNNRWDPNRDRYENRDRDGYRWDPNRTRDRYEDRNDRYRWDNDRTSHDRRVGSPDHPGLHKGWDKNGKNKSKNKNKNGKR